MTTPHVNKRAIENKIKYIDELVLSSNDIFKEYNKTILDINKRLYEIENKINEIMEEKNNESRN